MYANACFQCFTSHPLYAGTGSLDGETSGACTSNTIKVKIVDASVDKFTLLRNAPESHALQLSCHTSCQLLQDPGVRRGKFIPDFRTTESRSLIWTRLRQTIRPIEACEASGTNALDIATTARSELSTFVRTCLDVEMSSSLIG